MVAFEPGRMARAASRIVTNAPMAPLNAMSTPGAGSAGSTSSTAPSRRSAERDVREITLGPDDLADGALYYDRAGRECRQKARAVVLAANGIGTPRLLLNSASARFPDGLANSSGLVGKYIDLPDAYLSVTEALRAGGFAHRAKVEIEATAVVPDP